jgi:hypothetical protein
MFKYSITSLLQESDGEFCEARVALGSLLLAAHRCCAVFLGRLGKTEEKNGQSFTVDMVVDRTIERDMLK